MEKISENPSNRNFTMLSKKMHDLFLHYILGGRIRAPPEAELTFLISTFQNGAKTDRRALQCKFKSWAKRMIVENYKLKLLGNGKEIISLEDSSRIVMHIHFQGHLSVDQVINQIQCQYTWSKKNFGLDRDVIVDFILKNCKSQDCIEAVKSAELVRNYKCDNFIKDVIVSSESRVLNQHNQLPQSLTPKMNPTVRNWPIRHPPSTSPCGLENTGSCISTEISRRSLNFSKNLAKLFPSKKYPKTFGNIMPDTHNLKTLSVTASNGNSNYLDLETKSRIVPRSFRKPKNVIDFQMLLDAAEQCGDYPAVLNNPKTKFLGSFGLAPKRICSKRTLSRVEKEKKRNRAQYIQNRMYNNLNRKNLRDRNKLNKIKLKEQMEKRAYLDNFKRNSTVSTHISVSESVPVAMRDDSFYFASDESRNITSSADENEVEIVAVAPKKHEPEIIEIDSSSDDEMGNKSLKATVTDNKGVISSKRSLDLTTNQQGNKPCNIINRLPLATPLKYFPIFKQPFVKPSNSKKEALSSSRRFPTNVNKSVCTINGQAINFCENVKKPIAQSITNMAKPKSLGIQKLMTAEIANKIPHGTNIYVVKKQPSGVIKMVPCSKIVGSKRSTCSKVTSKEDRPVSVVNPVNQGDIPSDTRYRTTRIAPDTHVGVNWQMALDARKLHLDEEMTKLSKCIGVMKGSMARTYYHLNLQKSKQKLESQLNAAIALVKNIRRKLWEIEKLEEKAKNNIISKNTKNVK